METKTAIITAAGKGIGAAIARELAASGYRVSLLSNSDGAVKLAKELGGIGMTGSVAEAADLTALVESTLRQFGRIDAVVNNTGHPPKGELLDISDADWHLGLDMLLLNVVRMARAVTPVFLKQGGGAIVNISTFSAFEPELSFPVSSALRSGLASFSKLYANRYAEFGIRINTVMPGFMDNYPVNDQNISKIPMKRYAKVQEVAKTVRFLLSDDAGYITGQSIRADGGLTRSI
ncbi:MAG: 3-oxoacyl-ACP reductase [Chloroflexi bacterium]|nr:SDR family oxidoreductase [Chloroflexi bacterium CFX1]MCK6569013.1 SDR family oxidoreductase [Anaerolineales bacterium]MCQ3953767.1 3-oxoacyl-ACP reductase [Chloroflexota bacterium]MDL1918607.1 SDR family oxidoreductase [Chloroflexi bacterium CFX5]NUQ59897.1 SDR family oxidoreductase [Anaerolineales bacterium]